MTVVKGFTGYAEQPFAWRGFELSELRSARRKLIDAAWIFGGDYVDGDTGSGDYTSVAYVEGEGKGATITPAGGDTDKIMFALNAGRRHPSGSRGYYGNYSFFWSTTNYNDTNALNLRFYPGVSFSTMYTYTKLRANSLRCVRS